MALYVVRPGRVSGKRGRAICPETEGRMSVSQPPTEPPAPPPGKMRTPPEIVKWLEGAVTTEREAARAACKSAWRLDERGKPAELLPAPAGVDEARMRYPQYFAAYGGAAPGGAEQPNRGAPVDDERARDDHVSYWSAVIRGSDWPADVTGHAVAAVEARGPRIAADAMLRLAACDGWQSLPAHYRAVLRTVLVDGASRTARDGKRHCWVYPGTANATIGSTRLDGTGWRQPDPAALENDPDAPPWAPVSDVDASAAVWPAAASGIAFKGRMTLLSGAAKQGKSTLAGAAAAGVASGADWLTGEATAPLGSVIWIGAPGESQADEVNRLAVQAGAPPAALARLHFMPMRPSAGIVAALGKHAPPDLRLVVIDSARGLLTADGGEEDRSDDVRRTLGALAKWQAEHAPGAAVVAIHHMRRDRDARTGDRTRGSGDWLAAVDVVVEFDRTATGAELTYSGRTGAPTAPLFLTWHGERYAPGRPPDTRQATEGTDMDGDTIVTDRQTYDRVLGYLARTPDEWQSTRTIRERTGARAATVGTALDQLLAAGRVERKDGPRKSLLYRVTGPVPRVVPTGADPGGRNHGNHSRSRRAVPTGSRPAGTTREPLGNHSREPFPEWFPTL